VYKKRTINGILFIIKFLSALLMTVIAPMIAVLAAEFDLTIAQSGLLFTSQFMGYAVLIIIGGFLSDRLGKKTVLTIVLIMLVISLAAFSASQSFGYALAVLFFAGGLCGPLESLTISVLVDLNPQDSEKYINLSTVPFGIGAALGPVAAAVCIQSSVPWRIVYVGLAVLCAIMLAVFLSVKIPKPAEAKTISLKAAGTILKDKRFMLVCVCIFLYCGAESSGWGWMSEYMEKGLAFSALKSSAAVAVFWLSVTAGRVVLYKLLGRVSARLLVGVIAGASAAVTFGSAFVSSEAFAWTLIVLMGLFYSSQWPLMVGQTVNRHASYTGTSMAFLVCGGGLGMAAVPALLGVVSEKFGLFISQITPSFLFLAIIIIFCFDARPDKA